MRVFKDISRFSSCFQGKHTGVLVTNYKWPSTARSNETFGGEAQRVKKSNGERHNASAARPIRGKGRNPEPKGIASESLL
jgi:hypothetical protein